MLTSGTLNLSVLNERIGNEEEALHFLQDKGILHRERYCTCGERMTLAVGTAARPSRWRCYKVACKKERAVRTGTWLEGKSASRRLRRSSMCCFPGARLPFRKIIQFLYAWSRNYTTCRFCVQELGMQVSTAVQWNLIARTVAAEAVLRNHGIIGGAGLTVEVDESLFSRRKYNRGRTFPQQWVFRGCAAKVVNVSS